MGTGNGHDSREAATADGIEGSAREEVALLSARRRPDRDPAERPML